MNKTVPMFPAARHVIRLAFLSAFGFQAVPGAYCQDDIVTKAKAFVQKAAAPASEWSGPTDGPQAQASKTIVYVSSDQRNGGAKGVGDGVLQAAKVIGWNVRVIDGRGSVEGRGQALGQAIALKPDGIILGGFDAKEQAQLLKQAEAADITIVGWHCGAKPGPIADPKVFTNVTTAAEDTAQAAAYLAIAQSDGKAGVVIFTDSAFSIALAKSDAMAAIIKQCPTCTLLETRVQSLANRNPHTQTLPISSAVVRTKTSGSAQGALENRREWPRAAPGDSRDQAERMPSPISGRPESRERGPRFFPGIRRRGYPVRLLAESNDDRSGWLARSARDKSCVRHRKSSRSHPVNAPRSLPLTDECTNAENRLPCC